MAETTPGGVGRTALGMAMVRAAESRRDDPHFDDPFEVDLPDMLAFKEPVLSGRGAVPPCRRAVVPADLRGDWATPLRAAGFDQAGPTAWLVEGLLVYLSMEETVRLLTTITSLSAGGSRLSCEAADPGTPLVAEARSTPSLLDVTQLWKGGLAGGEPEWLGGHGWRIEVRDRDAVAASYGRRPSRPSGGAFVTAIRA